MKRLFLMLAAAVAAAALVAGSGTAASSDTKGPPCTNIADGTAGYDFHADSSGTVQAIFTLEAPACSEESYRLEIYDLNGGTLPGNPSVDQPAVAGETIVTITYNFDAPTAPSSGVCIVVDTFWKKHLSDRGPDRGCVELPPNEPPGGTYH
jgi:hypothetical protein